MHAYMHTCIHAHMHVCMYACMHEVRMRSSSVSELGPAGSAESHGWLDGESCSTVLCFCRGSCCCQILEILVLKTRPCLRFRVFAVEPAR